MKEHLNVYKVVCRLGMATLLALGVAQFSMTAARAGGPQFMVQMAQSFAAVHSYQLTQVTTGTGVPGVSSPYSRIEQIIGMRRGSRWLGYSKSVRVQAGRANTTELEVTATQACARTMQTPGAWLCRSLSQTQLAEMGSTLFGPAFLTLTSGFSGSLDIHWAPISGRPRTMQGQRCVGYQFTGKGDHEEWWVAVDRHLPCEHLALGSVAVTAGEAAKTSTTTTWDDWNTSNLSLPSVQ